MRHFYWHTSAEGLDGLEWEVLVFAATLRTALDACRRFRLVLEGADGALRPSAEFAGFAAPATYLVADPSEDDSSEKDEEGCENEPWQWHANHGSTGRDGLAVKWRFTNPHAIGIFSAGAKRRDCRTCSVWWSRFVSPEDRAGRIWATVPSDRTPTKNDAESSASAVVPWGKDTSLGVSGRREASSSEAERRFESGSGAVVGGGVWGFLTNTGFGLGEVPASGLLSGGMLRRAVLAEVY